jgi:hypothetical protein
MQFLLVAYDGTKCVWENTEIRPFRLAKFE